MQPDGSPPDVGGKARGESAVPRVCIKAVSLSPLCCLGYCWDLGGGDLLSHFSVSAQIENFRLASSG